MHNHSQYCRFVVLLVWFAILSPGFCGCQETDRDSSLDEDEILSIGRGLTSMFYDRDLDALVDRIVDESFTIDKLTQFRQRVGDELGAEVELLDERVSVGGPERTYYGYRRFARFDGTERPVQVLFGFDELSQVWLFSVKSLPAEAPTDYANYETKTSLRLPFEGAWYAASGGPTAVHNASHCESRDQRFGSDFAILRQLCTFRSDGSRNEHYFAYGQTICAPGAGIVVEAVNDVPENRPGEMTGVAGNMVVVDHGNGEYSFLCHLKCGSVLVLPGDSVTNGQVIGLCGNSGHSTEPGLHYHLQNTPVLFDGDGLPLQFENYTAEGEFVPRGVVLGGQTVMNGRVVDERPPEL